MHRLASCLCRLVNSLVVRFRNSLILLVSMCDISRFWLDTVALIEFKQVGNLKERFSRVEAYMINFLFIQESKAKSCRFWNVYVSSENIPRDKWER